jgi:hypothetical protein
MKNLAAITATHRLDNFSKAELHIPDAPELPTGATVCGRGHATEAQFQLVSE